MEVEYANLYRSLVNNSATPQEAWIHATKGGHKVTVNWNQKDLVQEKTRNFISSFATEDDKSFSLAGFPSELNGVHIYAPSPSGKFVAIIRAKEDNSPAAQLNTEYFIEIWSASKMVYNISAKGKVGFIYNDEWFGGVVWSPDETKLVFPAQPFVKNGISFWAPDESKDAAPTMRGHQYDFVEDWGEAYINKSTSKLFYADLVDQTVKPVPGIPPELVATGQAVWRNDSKSLAFVGWPLATNERRLGIKYCYNRHSQIFLVDVNDENASATVLTQDDYVARTPRFSPDGTHLIYLAAGKVGSHNTCNSLKMIDVEKKSSVVVIDIVEALTSFDDFPGLFVGNMPSRCFLDNDHVLFDSVWHSERVLLIATLSEKKIERVIPKGYDDYAWAVLDVVNGRVLAAVSTLAVPPFLVYTSNWNGIGTNFIRVVQQEASDISTQLAALAWNVRTVSGPPQMNQYLTLFPAKRDNAPLVVYAHGGPHSAFTNEWNHTVAFLSLLGYAVILINFRGSLGFGKKLIDDLAGHIGTNDVEDCIACVDHVLKDNNFDKERIVYIGGSHGGFLGGHLIAKDSRFKAAVLRNPVTNIGSMFGVTDIPDWCAHMTQTLDLSAMMKASPMGHINNVKTPTLFLIGDSDKRVPPSQGTQMYYALKEKGVPTAIKWYPKNGHAISKAEAEADAWVNAALWFNKYLSKY